MYKYIIIFISKMYAIRQFQFFIYNNSWFQNILHNGVRFLFNVLL